MDIVFNNTGTPLLFQGNKSYGQTVTTAKPVTEEPYWFFSHNKIEYAYWGDSNRYPDKALETIGKTGVLSTG
jgi:hypothetical protein